MNVTKQEILQWGEMLIRTKGYHAFSYADIAKPLKIKNAAVHYHFPSKADLGSTIIANVSADFNEFKDRTKSLDPATQLQQFIGIYDKSLALHRVCIVGALSPIVDTLPLSMQKALQAFAEELLQWLTAVLTAGKTQQLFQLKDEPVNVAHGIIALLMASLLLNNIVLHNAYSIIIKSVYQFVHSQSN